MTALPDWLSLYVDIPYRQDGTDFTGCNCWGLVRLVYKNQCGIELPEYADCFSDDLSASGMMMESAKQYPWYQVQASEIRTFDVVHMTSYPTINGRRIKTAGHCGVMVSSERLLHVWESPPPRAVHVPVAFPRIAPRILGFYRHEELA